MCTKVQFMVNKNLSTLSTRFEQNLLSNNNIKIQAMILGSSTYKYDLYINGMEIEVKPIFKILRVTTEELPFDMLHFADVFYLLVSVERSFSNCSCGMCPDRNFQRHQLPSLDRQRFAIRRKYVPCSEEISWKQNRGTKAKAKTPQHIQLGNLSG